MKKLILSLVVVLCLSAVAQAQCVRVRSFGFPSVAVSNFGFVPQTATFVPNSFAFQQVAVQPFFVQQPVLVSPFAVNAFAVNPFVVRNRVAVNAVLRNGAVVNAVGARRVRVRVGLFGGTRVRVR